MASRPGVGHIRALGAPSHQQVADGAGPGGKKTPPFIWRFARAGRVKYGGNDVMRHVDDVSTMLMRHGFRRNRFFNYRKVIG